jgi:microcin C transport system substrate-binding protein
MKKMALFCLILSGIILVGCGGLGNKVESTADALYNGEPAAKDMTTPPEEGGYGFEKIAVDRGYETYVLNPETDYPAFGDPRAKKGGTLTHISSRFPATMRIVGQNYNYEENISIIAPLCYESLLGLHPVTLKYVPGLASHWKISDDKMTYWFRINPDARFTDGRPVTADDVIATWDLNMDETILMPSSQLVYGKFERPEAEGKYIVKVKSKNLNWRNFLYFSGMNIMPAHYLRQVDGTEFLKRYQYTMVPGSGPYVIYPDDIVNQESFTFTRRDNYWAADDPMNKYIHNFDRVKIVVVKDNRSLMFEKFKKGECDFYPVYSAREWHEETDFEAVRKGWVQKRKVYSNRPVGTSGFAFNMRKWPFNDRRIRYAFAYLYNREKMNEEMYYNEYDMMNSLYTGSIYENPDNEKITYNPEKAVKLLEEAGYTKRNEDGWLINEDGQVLRFEIAIQKSVDYMVTPVQQMLKDYGIDMQIKFMDGNAIWKNLMDRNFTIFMQSWGGLVFPNPETTLHSSLADKKNNNNISGFANERVDELLEEYDQCFDQDRRVEIIREIDGIYADIRPAAWGIARTSMNILYWNKLGHPDFVFDRYNGDYTSIFRYWWYEPEKDARLQEAMKNNKTLPQGELIVRYWDKFSDTES